MGKSNRPKFVIMMRSNEVKSLQGPVKTSLHSSFIYSVDIYPTWARPWAYSPEPTGKTFSSSEVTVWWEKHEIISFHGGKRYYRGSSRFGTVEACNKDCLSILRDQKASLKKLLLIPFFEG